MHRLLRQGGCGKRARVQKGCADVQYEVDVNGRRRQVNIRCADGRFVVVLDGREWTIDAAPIDSHTMSLLVGDTSHEVTMSTDPVTGQLAVAVGGVRLTAALNGHRRSGRKDDGGSSDSGPQRLVAPMPGKVVRVLVSPGETVLSRQALVVIEAMKMENELCAARDGVVAEVHAREGQSVNAGTLLVVVTPE